MFAYVLLCVSSTVVSDTVGPYRFWLGRSGSWPTAVTSWEDTVKLNVRKNGRKICQIELADRMPDRMSDRMSERYAR